jgi:hypothetical protein
VGALTESERDHIKECLWCQEKLVAAHAPTRRRQCKHPWIRVAVVVLGLCGLCFYPIAVVLSKSDGVSSVRRILAATQFASEKENRDVKRAPVAVDSGRAETEVPTVYTLGEVFGRKPGAEEAIRIVNESRKDLSENWSSVELTRWTNDELELLKSVGDPCYFSALVRARLEMAHGVGVVVSKALTESSEQVKRVKIIGVKQELINLQWNRTDVEGCAALVDQAKREKTMRRRQGGRKVNMVPNHALLGEKSIKVPDEKPGSSLFPTGGHSRRRHASASP